MSEPSADFEAKIHELERRPSVGSEPQAFSIAEGLLLACNARINALLVSPQRSVNTAAPEESPAASGELSAARSERVSLAADNPTATPQSNIKETVAATRRVLERAVDVNDLQRSENFLHDLMILLERCTFLEEFPVAELPSKIATLAALHHNSAATDAHREAMEKLVPVMREIEDDPGKMDRLIQLGYAGRAEIFESPIELNEVRNAMMACVGPMLFISLSDDEQNARLEKIPQARRAAVKRAPWDLQCRNIKVMFSHSDVYDFFKKYYLQWDYAAEHEQKMGAERREIHEVARELQANPEHLREYILQEGKWVAGGEFNVGFNRKLKKIYYPEVLMALPPDELFLKLHTASDRIAKARGFPLAEYFEQPHKMPYSNARRIVQDSMARRMFEDQELKINPQEKSRMRWGYAVQEMREAIDYTAKNPGCLFGSVPNWYAEVKHHVPATDWQVPRT